jgi:hypothetical protein
VVGRKMEFQDWVAHLTTPYRIPPLLVGLLWDELLHWPPPGVADESNLKLSSASGALTPLSDVVVVIYT